MCRLLGLSIALILWLELVCCQWEPYLHLGRRRNGNLYVKPSTETDDSTSGFGPTEATFQQPIDHFTDNPANFSQRYFASRKYLLEGGPVIAFLVLGGNGPADISWVQDDNFYHMQLVKQYRAAVFHLEHRFYGESLPFDNQTAANLAYLTTRQAVEDAAFFIRTINLKYKWESPKWIVIGGSYGGTLALWLRSKYPNLTVGAYASSPLMEATVDFHKYNEVVDRALGTDCSQKIEDAFIEAAGNMNSGTTRETLKTTFELDPPLAADSQNVSYNDMQFFFHSLASLIQLAVQFNPESEKSFAYGFGIETICGDTGIGEGKLAGLENLNKLMRGVYGTAFTTTPNSYDQMIDYLKIEEFTYPNDTNFDAGFRSWTWQSCSEFASFPTTDSGEKAFPAPVIPLNLFINICEDVFGDNFKVWSIQDSVDRYNEHYLEDGYNATNVVIINGGNDPYRALMTDKLAANVISYTIQGASHCTDIMPIDPQASHATNINTAHKLIGNNVDKWIKQTSAPAMTQTSISKTTRPSPQHSQAVINAQAALIPSAATPDPDILPTQYRRMHMGRPPFGFTPPPEGNYSSQRVNFEVGFFVQPLDHFDNTNPNTLNQKYFVNEAYATENGPIFLIIGGSGPESSKWVLTEESPIVGWAKFFGATIYLLEHRFYGDSRPTATVPKQEEFLNSIQALYDINDFVTAVNKQLSYKPSWITFGGSYSGSIALWSRSLFPETIVGAVGSSAPLQAKYDFYEYMLEVESAIKNYNADCATKIGQAFEEIRTSLLDDAKRTTFEETFKLEKKFSAKPTEPEKQLVFYLLYSEIQLAVQYSNTNIGTMGDSIGIPQLCSFMTKGTPLDALKQFHVNMTLFFNPDMKAEDVILENDYDEFKKYLQLDTTPEVAGGDEIKYNDADKAVHYWTWQSCVEFGHFQSTDGGNSIFGSPTPVNLFSQLCTDVFDFEQGLTSDAIEKNIKLVNEISGGQRHYQGTNVVIPNGSLDPWRVLSVHKSRQDGVNSYLINGTSHCADLYPPRASDPADLVLSRQRTAQAIATWLNVDPPVTEITEIPATGSSNPSTKPSSNTTTTTTISPEITTKSSRSFYLFFSFLFILIRM